MATPSNPPSTQPNQVTAGDVIKLAKEFLGIPYVYGGESPKGFDCSGLVQYVYGQLGINLPRTSEEQFAAGTPVSAKDALPGDLVFFGGSGPGYYYDGTPSSPGHVGIYIGNGQMINAPTTGEDVKISSTDGAVGYRRVLGTNALVGAAGTATTAITNIGNTSFTSALGKVWSDVTNGVSFWPSTIVGTFGDVDTFVGDLYKGYTAFFQPSTYVRIGAGLFGFVFFLAGLFFLLREAHS